MSTESVPGRGGLAMSAAKRELLARLLGEAGVVAPEPGRIRPRPGDAPAPLSFAQERLWFLAQLEAESAAYHIPGALRLRGALDHAALERALGEVARRHEVLRTTFHEVDGAPVQRVHPDVDVRLPVLDLAGLDTEERERVVRREARELAERPFDLRTGPLFRAELLRTADDEHLLIFCMHHIVSDGWSAGVLVPELSALYGAFVRGEASPLPELEVQYADYAVWQREQLQGEVLREHLDYWRGRLRGAPDRLELPLRGDRPAQASAEGAQAHASLPAGLARRLEALAVEEGTTPFTLLLAAFQLLLGRYSGQTDVVVGSPVANRTRREIEPLIGFFVNLLALRTDLSGDPPFRELLRRVRESTLGDYQHQDLPFARLVEELSPARHLDQAPLFQVVFNMLPPAPPQMQLSGVAIEQVPLPAHQSGFDLTLYASQDRGGGLGLEVHYRTDLFAREQIAALLDHFRVVLQTIADDPARRISAIPLGSPASARALTVPIPTPDGWAQAPRAEIEQPIARRFEAVARQHADRVAVRAGGAAWTYARLNARANALAHRILAARGAGEERVALLVSHGGWTPVSILGALKAGKTYVPLDPRLPAERLAQMLEDAEPSLIISDEANRALADRLAERGGLSVLRMEDGDAPDPQIDVPSDRPAYILYTSGSTGQPKGVVQSHRNVLHFIRVYGNNLRVTPDDRLSLLPSYAFDAAVMDLFGALLNGAALCVYDIKGDEPVPLPEWIRRERITIYHSTPTVFRYLAGLRADADALSSVRLAVLGGEAVIPGDIELFNRHFPPSAVLVNGLGPTESTVTLQNFIAHGTAPEPESVSVGFPVDDTRVVLMNALGEQPAVYGRGELVIHSPHVALGYWRRPDLTDAAFGAADGVRSYRMGDVGRWLADGRIQYLGRVDDQVQIRGQRVEPGEVEAVLRAHPAVRQTVVIAREQDGETVLVAYVVASDPAAPPADLRDHLRARLPEYMVPSAFVTIDPLPFTTHGKVDRRALPEPESPAASPSTVAAGREDAPRGPTEEVLAEIWAGVLGMDRVGIHDDFFELGGHSLRAIQVLSLIEEALGVRPPLRVFFDAPTVAAVGARVDEMRAAGAGVESLAIQPAPRDPPPPLSFAQERLWFLDQLEPGSTLYNVVFRLRLAGALDADALERGLAAVVARHEVLRTVFRTTDDGLPVQVPLPRVEVRLDRHDLAELSPGERTAAVEGVARMAAKTVFDLRTGPLLRATLARVSMDEHHLVLVMHHVVSDAWSTQVLARELSALYAAEVDGAAPALPPLPVQYADYAVWQRARLSGEPLRRLLEYWRGRMAGAPELLDLPTDRPRAAAPGGEGGTVFLDIPGDTTRALRALARREQCTPFMAALAVFQLLLGRYGGEHDVVTGTPVADRTRRETEPLIGFFVNLLALRTDLSGDPTVSGLLARVKEAALGAYEHQDLPFEKLVEALGAERGLAHAPLFQVVFALQHAPPPAPSFQGLRWEALPGDGGDARYDLTLVLAEAGDGLRAACTYRADLFDAGTVRRMLEHYRALLEQATASPRQRLSELTMLSADERRTVVEVWNQSAGEIPRAHVHELIARQAQRAPDAVALARGGETLTFREMEARANRLAHRLRARGVGPEVAVGGCLERGMDQVVGMLAVLKAGGAWLPLDPAHPADRLAFILRDTGAPLVLAHAHLRPRLPAEVDVIAMDAVEWEDGDASAPEGVVAPHNLAYLVYTSGSMGQPKGVMIEHRGVGSMALALGRAFDIRPGDRVFQFTAPGFDAALADIFFTLAAGATLHLPAEGALMAGSGLAQALAEPGITHVTLLPSVLATLPPDRELPALRTLTVGGEAFPAALAAQWEPRVERLINAYGPTETTIGACVSRPLRGMAMRTTPPPVGGPYANMRCYVVDAHGAPCPVGVPGELWIGGVGVGRGYLGKPGMTAEKFIPDPFATEPGGRLYRTGDRMRWLASGELEFLGRIDEQVKVRGFRIEPGEIEAALLAHPAVAQAAVIVRDDEDARRLVGYAVPAAAEDAAALREALREHLRGRLPAYLVPDALVVLDALPLTPNGKLDRRALPAPARGGEGEHVAPRTPAEAALAGIWAEVLRVERVGVHDNFFELGGDSIQSIQVVARARRAGLRITPREMFAHPTVARLAAAVRETEGEAAPPAPAAGPVPLTPVQRWFFAQPLADRTHWNQTVLLAPARPVNLAALRAALRHLAAHHDALRLRFVQADGEWRASHAPLHEGEAPVDEIDLSAVPANERAAALERASAGVQGALHLERGPLIRGALIRLGPEDERLLLTAHHLVVDAVSWRILLEDLHRAYEQVLRGEPVALPSATAPFGAWAARLAEHAHSDEVLAEANFWTGDRWRTAPELPVDFPGGGNDEASARAVHVELDEDETRALLREVPSAYGARMDDALLAALATALGRWTGSPRVLVDVEGHGREPLFDDLDVSRTVGWFTALYPVLLDVDGADAAARLRSVKDQLRAIPGRGIGHGLLRWLGPAEVRARLADQPHPAVVLNYLGQLDPPAGEDPLFAPAPESSGAWRGGGGRRPHVLAVEAHVRDGRLRAGFVYGARLHREDTIARLAEAFAGELRALVRQVRARGERGYTPQDFPRAGLSQAALDAVLRQLGAAAQED